MYYFPSECAFGKPLQDVGGLSKTFAKDVIGYDDILLTFLVKVLKRSPKRHERSV